MDSYVYEELRMLRNEIKELYFLLGGIKYFVNESQDSYEVRISKIKKMIDEKVK